MEGTLAQRMEEAGARFYTSFAKLIYGFFAYADRQEKF
jgi:hypothetical protein